MPNSWDNVDWNQNLKPGRTPNFDQMKNLVKKYEDESEALIKNPETTIAELRRQMDKINTEVRTDENNPYIAKNSPTANTNKEWDQWRKYVYSFQKKTNGKFIRDLLDEAINQKKSATSTQLSKNPLLKQDALYLPDGNTDVRNQINRFLDSNVDKSAWMYKLVDFVNELDKVHQKFLSENPNANNGYNWQAIDNYDETDYDSFMNVIFAYQWDQKNIEWLGGPSLKTAFTNQFGTDSFKRYFIKDGDPPTIDSEVVSFTSNMPWLLQPWIRKTLKTPEMRKIFFASSVSNTQALTSINYGDQQQINTGKAKEQEVVNAAYNADLNTIKAKIAKEKEAFDKEINDVKYAKEEEELRKEYDTLKIALAKKLEGEPDKRQEEADKEIAEKEQEEEEKTAKQHEEDIKFVEDLAVKAIQDFKDKTAEETRTRCSKTTAKQGAKTSINRIQEEVNDEYDDDDDDDEDDEDDDDDDMTGGNIANIMYKINKRYVMNSPIQSAHKTSGNASKRVMVQKLYGGRVRPVRTGLAGLAIEVAELIWDLWGDQIKNFFLNAGTNGSIGSKIVQGTKTQAQKDAEQKNKEAVEAYNEYLKKQIIINRVIALYKVAMIEDADERLDQQEDILDDEFDNYKDAIEDELDAYLDELQDELEEELDRLEEENDTKIDRIEDETKAKISEIEKEAERKREEDKAVLIAKKNQELAQQNSFITIPQTPKTVSMTIAKQDQTRHDATQVAKAKEELRDEGNVPVEGKGKKINKRAEIVKKIMKKKGLNMIEASKYVKSHNLY